MAQSYSSQPDQVNPEPVFVPEAAARRTVNWPHVWAYIGLSFGLAWLCRPGAVSEWRPD